MTVREQSTLKTDWLPDLLALGDLLLLVTAEAAGALIHARAGLVLHAVLLLVLLIQHAELSSSTRWVWLPIKDQPGLSEARPITNNNRGRGLFLALAFAPLMRLTAFALPLGILPQVSWYLAISLPLFIAALVAARTLGWTRAAVGLQLGSNPRLQLLIGLSGLVIGYVAYQILTPQPLAASWHPRDTWLPALILIICTGLFEELIFRGLMQRAAKDLLGNYGIFYVAAVYTALHIGYKSTADLLLMGGVGLFFGWVTSTTRSILGAALAHGLANVMIYLVMPFLALGGPLAGTSPTGIPVGTAIISGLAQDTQQPRHSRNPETQQQRNQGNPETFVETVAAGAGGRSHHLLQDQQGQQNENDNQTQRVRQNDVCERGDCGISNGRNHADSEVLLGNLIQDRTGKRMNILIRFQPDCQAEIYRL